MSEQELRELEAALERCAALVADLLKRFERERAQREAKRAELFRGKDVGTKG